MKPISELSDIELREAVAVEVMGKKVRAIANDDSKHAGEYAYCYDGGAYCRDYLGDGALVEDRASGSWEIPYYESSTEAAFEVVAKMRTILNRWGGRNRLLLEQKPDGMFKAAFYGDETNWEASAWVDAATAPRAICMAALTAIRERKA